MIEREKDLICTYKPENEFLALSLKALLEKENIFVLLRSEQIPWYDGIMTTAKGYWGKIFVYEKDASKAGELIKGFLTDKDNK
ncbi:MAG: DUF2007 domain-containing protein [Candidatus Omnitrophica bacterium]|nr:DUF2007 domain-containing protein [Candidatus Omnitrophota bacterium]